MLYIVMKLINFHLPVSEELGCGAEHVHFKEMSDPGIRVSSSMIQPRAGVESIVTNLLGLYLR